MRYLLTLLFFCSLQILLAQENSQLNDSIEVIKNAKFSDSIKVKQLINIVESQSDINSFIIKKIINDALIIIQSDLYLFSDKYQKEALLYDHLGIIEKQNSNFDQSLKYYLKALSIKEKYKDSLTLGRSYHNIAMLFNSHKEFKKASLYMYKALPLRKKFNDSIQYAKSLNMYGLFKFKLKENDSALLFYNEAKKMFHTNIRVADVNNNIASLHSYNNEFEKAKNLYDENLIIFKKHKLQRRLAVTNKYLGTVYRNMKDFSKAEYYLNQSEVLAKQLNNKQLLSNVFLERYRIASYKKDHKKALEFYRVYKEYKDSVFNTETTAKLKEFELNYIFEKEKLADSLHYVAREQQLITITKAQKKQTRLYSFLFIVSLLGLISTVFLYRYKKRLNQESSQKELLKFELLNSKLENISNYAEQLEVDNNMRFQFKEKLLSKIKSIKDKSTTNDLKTYQSLIVDLQTQINAEKRLDTINKKANISNSKLENILSNQFPNLTKSEREVCNLIYLNLSNKEIMNIRNASLDSIKSARYRIRKKLQVSKGTELEKFIKNLI